MRLQADSGLRILRCLQSVLADKRLFRQIITEMEDSSRDWSIKEHEKLDVQTSPEMVLCGLTPLLLHSSSLKKEHSVNIDSSPCPNNRACCYFFCGTQKEDFFIFIFRMFRKI